MILLFTTVASIFPINGSLPVSCAAPLSFLIPRSLFNSHQLTTFLKYIVSGHFYSRRCKGFRSPICWLIVPQQMF
ncbi:hypothetical protein BDW68DRAFT_171322 [Aspergillus falconensis]